MAYLHHSSQEYVDEKVRTETDARTAAINAAKAHLQSLIQSEASRASGQEAILQQAINNIQTFEVVIADTLPDPSKLCAKKIYLVPSANPKATNTKDEYICVKQSGTWKWEQIGSTAITIEYDTEPTDGSSKHVRSGGIYAWVKEEVRKLTSWITDRLANKADRSALNAHVENTNNPHGVTAEKVGALSISRANTDQTFDWSLSGGGVRLFGTYYGTGIGLSLNSGGGELLNYHDDDYDWYKLPTGKSGTLAIVEDISATNQTFSNAVLAVGLNIDNEKLQWLKDIGAIAGSTTGQVGIGTLPAALLAALMWLKNNKIGSFKSVGGASATVENGVAKLDDFFTNSNSLLMGTIAANSARLALDEDGEIIVTMNMED